MHWSFAVFVRGLAVPALAVAAGWPLQSMATANRAGDMPKDAAAFIARTEACNHWAGEDPFSPERALEIRQAVRRLKCNRLESDERRLRHKHRQSPAVLEAIEEAKSMS